MKDVIYTHDTLSISPKPGGGDEEMMKNSQGRPKLEKKKDSGSFSAHGGRTHLYGEGGGQSSECISRHRGVYKNRCL